MVQYNPKSWITAILRIPKADTFRILFPTLICIALYSWGIVHLEINYLKLSANSNAKNITIMHTLLGFAISMLLVFRTNTAYDRWWEGRKLWGSLVNNSRNLAIKTNAFIPKNETNDRLFFKQIIPQFAIALKLHLLKESTRLELDENLHPEISQQSSILQNPTLIANSIINKITNLYKSNVITAEQFLILNTEMQSFADITGACERIKNTPIPYSYSAFIKKFIFLYVISMPFGFAINLSYFTIPVTTFIFYVLASLEIIAEEIEDPFGKDTNDLPMQKMSETIKNSCTEILS